MLAIDMGGTYIRYKSNKRYGTNNKYGSVKTKNVNINQFLKELVNMYSPSKVAIAFAGQVCDNKILSSPNINVKEISLDVPYVLENDLNAAALAESRYFSCKHLVALYSGTGLGCGAIENGKIVRGFKNLACEIGHVPYKKAPFVCGCGKDNCLELYASGSGIEKWAKYSGCSNKLEKTCQKMRDAYLEAITYAAALLVTIFNPQILVLGGGVVKNNEFVVEHVKRHIDSVVPSFSRCKILKSELEDASLKGAEILLKEMA